MWESDLAELWLEVDVDRVLRLLILQLGDLDFFDKIYWYNLDGWLKPTG